VADSDAKAKKLTQYESRMAEAIPQLYAIDPTSPTARREYAAFAKQYPELLHNEPGLPSALSEFSQGQRMMQAHAENQQKQAVEAEKAAATQSAEGRRQWDRFVHEDESKERQYDHSDEAAQTRQAAKEKKKENHEKEKDYAGRQLDAIAAGKPTWLDSTGLYTDENGKQYFGYKDKEKNDPSTVATPDQIRQYQEYQSLKSDYDLHDKALSYIRKSELAEADPAAKQEKSPPALQNPNTGAPAATPPPENVSSTTPPANPNLTAPPPATEQDQAAPVGEDVVAPVAAAVTPPPSPNPAPPPADAVAPAATPHPYEGKRVLQKSTGKYGTFTNGQFIPEGTEAQ
jgi:hypothetical protein